MIDRVPVSIYSSEGVSMPATGSIVRLEKEVVRPNDTTPYAVGDSVGNGAMIELTHADMNAGGSGFIHELTIETNCTAFAGATIRLWLYNAAIASIPADNAAFINAYANTAKRIGVNYLDVVFDSLLAGSDTVFGRVQLPTAVRLVDAKIYALMQTLTAVTPTASCKFNIKANFLKLT
jgi:hypothetical protein